MNEEKENITENEEDQINPFESVKPAHRRFTLFSSQIRFTSSSGSAQQRRTEFSLCILAEPLLFVKRPAAAHPPQTLHFSHFDT